MIRYIGDLHLNAYRTLGELHGAFSSLQEYKERLIEEWNKEVDENDTVYIVGDVSFDIDRYLDLNGDPIDDLDNTLSRLKGNKVLILGNHDDWILDCPRISKHFSSIHSYLRIEDGEDVVCMSHYPMVVWQDLRFAKHVFAHAHDEYYDLFLKCYGTKPKAFNCGLPVIGLAPKTLKEIEVIQTRDLHRASYYKDYPHTFKIGNVKRTNKRTTKPSMDDLDFLVALKYISELVYERIKIGVSEITEKDGFKDLVTDIDMYSNRLLMSCISETYLDIPILSEEEVIEVDSSKGTYWVLDPLDGTSNLVSSDYNKSMYSTCCISLAYVEEGVTKLGVVIDITSGNVYVAELGRGCYLNDIQVQSKLTSKRTSLASFGLPKDKSKLNDMMWIISSLHGEYLDVKRVGPASFDMINVGLGVCGTYVEYDLKPWDYLASKLFIEELGGRVEVINDGLLKAYNKYIVR